MARAFADITFTPSVKKAQQRYGSRESNRGFEEMDDPFNTLSPSETTFIEERDSFYMATVNENGWPYVQHRGGPVGFLKVIDDRTIGFADYRGNRQYLSVGNLGADQRISLILMDYPNKRRLKLWGKTKIVHYEEAPEMIATLEDPHYRARIERALVIRIEAIEWNCPQHITPRFSQQELEAALKDLRVENEALKKQNQISAVVLEEMPAEVPTKVPTKVQGNQNKVLGSGPLALKVTSVSQLTPRIRSYRFQSLNDHILPRVTPGANIQVPVFLEDGQSSTRSYSICSNVKEQSFYEIAVLKEPEGRGGSSFVHQNYALGTELRCELPQNNFVLDEAEKPVVLIAGGIGITPIKAMALSLKENFRTFHLHYAGRARKEMAFAEELEHLLGESLTLYNDADNKKLNLETVLTTSPDNAVFYVCGPAGLIEGLRETAEVLGIDEARIHFELFSRTALATDKAVQLNLHRSNKVIEVEAGQSLLEALLASGVNVPFSCEAGNCRTCAVTVIDGEPDHRDMVLTAEEKKNTMCPCVSRAHSESLTLDI